MQVKKLEIIIRPEKFETLKEILTDNQISGMMITNIMGFGNQMGHTQQYRSVKYSVNLVMKLRVEVVVRDEMVAGIVSAITTKLSTGRVGDGKIFINPVENAVRIRTGESGEQAL